MSFDPLNKEYNDLSPYHFAGDNPIKNLDLDGGEPLDYTYNWIYVKIQPLLGGVSEWNAWDGDNWWDYQTIYDKVTKRFWFIHSGNDGKTFYWKYNPGADQSTRSVSNKNGGQNGYWAPFETQNEIQARIGKEVADGLAQFWYIVLGSVLATNGRVLMWTGEAVVEELAGIPNVNSLDDLARIETKQAANEAEGLLPSLPVTFRSVKKDDIKGFIVTEEAAQSSAKVVGIKKAINSSDPFVWAEPVYTTTHKGKTYILDGHHRLKATMSSDKTSAISVQELSSDKAREMFPEKMKHIEAGEFSKKISDDD